MSKFKVGDHVVVTSFNHGQNGMEGEIYFIDTFNGRIHIKYTYINNHKYFSCGQDNNYADHHIETSKVHNSPLYQALR